MNTLPSAFYLRRCALGVLMALSALSAQAQHVSQRLSTWIVNHDPYGSGYLAGLSWQVPEEKPAQLALKLELLQALGAAGGHGGLASWIAGLPVTGRVPIAVADPRWLEASPERDPLLLPGHQVVLPERPRTLTVVGAEGQLCRVPHVAGQEAGAYVRACAAPGSVPADWAWVAQPDGRVDRFGIAIWNSNAQDLPAPGAWIWAPPRDSRLPADFAQKLITFLSYQGPAPDHDGPAAGQTDSTLTHRENGSAADGIRWSSVARGLMAPAPSASVHSAKDAHIPPESSSSQRSQDLMVTAGDWGSVGLLQTPSARMREAGSFTFHVSRVEPYTTLNVFAQPFSWMEAGFRYTAISNQRYRDGTLTNPQSYKDKAFDVKFSLWDENWWRPAAALGFRDIAGTGFFSGEYVVASKRFGAIDASVGAGWGNLAGAPQRFKTGTPVGNFLFSNYFSGTPKPFGGLQWTLPGRPMVLKVEYEGNNYKNEPLGNIFTQKSHFNFGLTYRLYSWLDVTAGVERGNRFTIGLSLNSNLSRHSVPKLQDAPRIPVAPTRPLVVPDWAGTAGDIKTQTDWTVSRIHAEGERVTVTVEDPTGTYWQDRVDRAASVLHRDAPADINRFVLRYRGHGVDLAEQVIDRSDWVDNRIQPLPPSRQTGSSVIARDVRADEGKPQFNARPAGFKSDFRIGYTQSLGGPDGFVLYQIYAEQSARLRLGRPDTWLSGAVHLGLIDNYDKFRYTAPSNLPRVRTFIREYLTTSDVTIPYLQATHVRKLSNNQYVSVYGGYLEEMFGGFGGEWLYRPFASRLAYGVDVNVVRQRDFRQNFSFRDPGYQVTTGHATTYWDTGWNGVEMRLSAGRYLAGDLGATIEASRRFSNGVVFGAFATKTNVSAQQFGEGSFDKGIFVSIPFDALFAKSASGSASFTWKPLTRDGGAKLFRKDQLYDITRGRDLRTFEYKAPPLPDELLVPADHRPKWQPETQAPAVHAAVVPRIEATRWAADGDAAFALTQALERQGFHSVAVGFDQSYRLNLKVAHDALRPFSRAVGRAARTALAYAPADARELRIQFAERAEPLVEYDFLDLKKLALHLSGELPAAALRETTAVRYINPGAREADPLAALADVSTVPQIPAVNDVLSLTEVPARVLGDFGNAAAETRKVDWLGFAGVGIAAVAGSSLLDSKGLSFAKTHAKSSWLKGLNRVGDAVPWMGFVGAGLLALDGSDPRRSRTGYAAVEAGASAVMVATGLKYVIGRPRPNAKESKYSLHPFGGGKFDSMPSRHAALAWAVATPFALEYRAPWLYGIAGLSNLARVGKQKHWLSDTVAGSVIGYGLGRLFWESSRANSALPQVLVDPSSVSFSWSFY